MNELFLDRHLDTGEDHALLDSLGLASVSQLIEQTIPKNIRIDSEMALEKAMTEIEVSRHLSTLASNNELMRSLIGQGYYETRLPEVIKRNVLDNPAWYTAYTPYQPEIAQGRLEALINFQTAVIDLTGMEIANASLLDEGTAAAEAMTLLYRKRAKSKKKAYKFVVDDKIFPQTLAVLETRAEPLDIELIIADIQTVDLTSPAVYGVFVQYPNDLGEVHDWSAFCETARENDVLVGMAADLLSLFILKSPGEMGADVVVGTSQRFGIPMGFGGPHAGYIATKEAFKRDMPGRIIGRSKDADGNTAYRMALQTREQHIRREKATSNICTAQVLLAILSSMYLVYHGPTRMKKFAQQLYRYTAQLKAILLHLGYNVNTGNHFDTLVIEVEDATFAVKAFEKNGINIRMIDDSHVSLSLDEMTDNEEIHKLASIFADFRSKGLNGQLTLSEGLLEVPSNLQRNSDALDFEVFKKHHTEHAMLRYIKQLEIKDLSLVHSMIPLGSCTMKLNATSEMKPLGLEGFSRIHPFAPVHQLDGYREMLTNLERQLAIITGLDAVSFMPNSGAQGELAGLLVMKKYHEYKGDTKRDIVLIPGSAHGTNPASAVMAGQQVVIIPFNDEGNLDLNILKEKAEEFADRLMGFMITYPSTHGVFEEGVKQACEIVHQYGGLVYMDGANMNAQIGYTSPGKIGADVCHLNLHKTFCIPHGGGGPGMGPIAVVDKLIPFLPNDHLGLHQSDTAIGAMSSSTFGSASILTISYAYILLMGASGLKKATERAILNANYMMERLAKYYPILYRGDKGRCAHEFILDCRGFKSVGVEVGDIGRRLMDYGFHAPTVSFPVNGTLMIEPTESESKEEIDRYIDALVHIRNEIAKVEAGTWDQTDNPIVNAPHTSSVLVDDWTHAYTRKEAVFPLPFVKQSKFWPSVSKIDGAYGDRNLFCTCTPVEEYIDNTSTETVKG